MPRPTWRAALVPVLLHLLCVFVMLAGGLLTVLATMLVLPVLWLLAIVAWLVRGEA